MDWTQLLIAAALGLFLGWIMQRRGKVKIENVHLISKDDFFNNMRKGQLVDIRKKEQFEEDKIKGARHFTPNQLKGNTGKIRKDKSVYLYCNNGKKSYRLAKQLSAKDYQALYVLEGGLDVTKK